METTFQLSEEQLAELKKFITKRGMREPDVVNEILDHFACKIEELMSKEPNLLFEDAIKLAHKSFGSTGFRPITKAYEEGLDKIIWAEYKSSVKSVLLSPSILFAAIISILSFYLLQQIPPKYSSHWLWGLHFWTMMIPAIGLIAVSKFYGYKTKRKTFQHWKKKPSLNMWEFKAMGMQSFGSVFIISALVPNSISDKQIPPAFFIIASVICFLSLINALAQYKTMIKMYERFGGAVKTA